MIIKLREVTAVDLSTAVVAAVTAAATIVSRKSQEQVTSVRLESIAKLVRRKNIYFD